MAGPGICVLCLADTFTSKVHPVFNPVASYGYLLSDMYLSAIQICISICQPVECLSVYFILYLYGCRL